MVVLNSALLFGGNPVRFCRLYDTLYL